MQDWKAAKAKGPLNLDEMANRSVSNIVPYVQTLSNQNDMGYLSDQQIKPINTSQGSAIDQFGQFVGKFAGQVGDIVAGGAKALGNMLAAPVNMVGDFTHAVDVNNRVHDLQRQNDNVSKAIQDTISKYKSGQISHDDYAKSMVDLSDQGNNLTRQMNDATNSLKSNDEFQKEVVDTALDAVSIALAFPTGGASMGANITKTGVTAVADATLNVAAREEAAAIGTKFLQLFNSKNLLIPITDGSSTIAKIAEAANKITTIGGRFSSNTITKIVSQTAIEAGANATAQQIAKNVAINLLIKNPLIYQTNVGLATDIYKDIAKGNVGGATGEILIATGVFLAGGPIGAALESSGKGLKWLKAASFPGEVNAARDDILGITKGVSRDSYADLVSAKLGKDKFDLAKIMLEDLDKGDLRLFKAFKVIEEMNMQVSGGDVFKATDRFVNDIIQDFTAAKVKGMTMREIADTMLNYVDARDVAMNAYKNTLIKDGTLSMSQIEKESRRIVVGRASAEDLTNFTNAIRQVDTKMQVNISTILENSQAWEEVKKARQLAIMEEAQAARNRLSAPGNNDKFMAKIDEIITNEIDTDKAIKRINGIVKTMEYEGISKKAADEIRKLGYIATLPDKTFNPHVSFEETSMKLKTAFKGGVTGNNAKYFEQAVAPVPVLSSLGNLLMKAGLSPEASHNKLQQIFKDNFAENISRNVVRVESDNGVLTSDALLSKLYNFINERNSGAGIKSVITDLRQVTRKELQASLSVDEATAKKIMGSIQQSFLNIPLEIRGAGDALLDRVFNNNPLARKFSRVQGALRYSFNPFFKWQQAVQTETAAQLMAGGKMIQLPGLNKLLFGSYRAEVSKTMRIMESEGIFAKTMSTAESDLTRYIGSRVTGSEKKSIAGLVEQLARKNNVPVESYVKNNVREIADIAKVITQNDFKGDWLDSPLARTINTIFFPFRFNMKIAGFMAKEVSKMPRTTQIAIISNMIDMDEWSKSDEGVSWQTTHAEALGLFKWMSPFMPIQSVIGMGKDIVDPANASIGDFGQLGGLPFGWLTQFLESSGITNISQPYVNPTTGEVSNKYIPKDGWAAINLAMQDLIGAVFSYPGKLAGLPGKGEIIRAVTNKAVGAGNTETVAQGNRLTPEQKTQQSKIKKQVAANTPAFKAQTVAPKTQVTAATPQKMPVPAPVSYTKARALKKSQLPVQKPIYTKTSL